MTGGETVTIVQNIVFHIYYSTMTHRSGRGDGVGIGCCVTALPSLHEQVVRAGMPSSELMLEPLSSFSMLTPRDWLILLTDETSFMSIEPLQTQDNIITCDEVGKQQRTGTLDYFKTIS
jgi:hypothetical protein